MPTVYYEGDARLDVLRSKRIGVIGYGNQGHAHALNLRDSGCKVAVGLRPGGPSWTRAEADGFEAHAIAEVSSWADVISLLLPDQVHKRVYEDAIARNLTPGKLLITAHGFSILFGQIEPPDDVDVAMVAPVGPGHMMRRLFQDGLGEPALLAVYQDVSGQAEQLALAYAAGLGCARAGVVRTSFREETEANLFGEQAVLCGGLSHLIQAGFDTLVKAGYQPEIAYFECVHTVKLLADLIYEGGLASMRARISDTAEFGDYISGPRVIDDHVAASMQEVLRDIQDGSFARRWIADSEAGAPELERMRHDERRGEIEVVGTRLRSMMSWLTGTDAESRTESVGQGALSTES